MTESQETVLLFPEVVRRLYDLYLTSDESQSKYWTCLECYCWLDTGKCSFCGAQKMLPGTHCKEHVRQVQNLRTMLRRHKLHTCRMDNEHRSTDD